MKTKLITYLAVALVFTTTASAQVTFTLRAGMNLQNINGKNAVGDKLSNDVMPRYHFGALVNFPIAEDFSLQTGAIFETKGAKVMGMVNGVENSDNIQLNYVQVPITFMYTPLVGKGRVLMGFGPFAAYGVGGIVKTTDKPSQKVEWQNSVSTSDQGFFYYKPLEFGANFLFGYEFFNHLQVQFNAQLGLTEINPTDARVSNDKTSMKNTGFGLSLGWKF
jgi:hypothetical protein